MTAQTTLCVDRHNFERLTPIHRELADVKDGHIRVRVTSFALTANNVTYMGAGESFGYWKFFDPATYGIEGKNLGRMPVWGFAEVAESRAAGLEVSARLYGYFPPVDYFDLMPTKLNSVGFMDGTAHRLSLHPVYNHYVLTQNDPSFGGPHDIMQPILRPLFTTSFLIDDFLAREDFFGAEQVLLLSASSKTALGTAFSLSQRGGIKVAGLTSARNKGFVETSGFYNSVETYDSITDLNPDVKTAIVDMAGNGAVSRNVYDHFEENIVYNCMVGKSHWEGDHPPKISAGAPPIMFFAPDQGKQRMKDWGAAGFAKNLGARWIPFLNSAKDWMEIETHTGVEAFIPVYQALLRGDIPAHVGPLMRL